MRLGYIGFLGFALAYPSITYAQAPANPEAVALDGGVQRDPHSEAETVEQCWAQFLTQEGLKDGKNERDDDLILVSQSTSPVLAPTNSKNWVIARNAAFNIAELQARKALSETIRVTMNSNRSATTQKLGGDDSPPPLKAVSEHLSLVDKSQVLADKAVDAEIKKYDPDWSGDPTQRERKVVELQQKFGQKISSSSELFAAGGFTVAQCEGPSGGGDSQYSVLVGFIWSKKLERVAESIWDPSVRVPSASPGKRLAEHFDDLSKSNPDWMAYTEGARVFTDEKGNRVVVGFGVAPRSILAAADQDEARLEALAAIQRFVGEKIVGNAIKEQQFEFRQFTDESTATFNPSAFQENITAISKEMELNGTAEVGSWRGNHPWSKAGMQVVAIAWSQSWSKDSKEIGKVMDSVEEYLRNKGAVPRITTGPRKPAAGVPPAATTAKPGASSSTKDF